MGSHYLHILNSSFIILKQPKATVDRSLLANKRRPALMQGGDNAFKSALMPLSPPPSLQNPQLRCHQLSPVQTQGAVTQADRPAMRGDGRGGGRGRVTRGGADDVVSEARCEALVWG